MEFAFGRLTRVCGSGNVIITGLFGPPFLWSGESYDTATRFDLEDCACLQETAFSSAISLESLRMVWSALCSGWELVVCHFNRKGALAECAGEVKE